MAEDKGVFTKWLEESPNWVFTYYVMGIYFSTFFCAYAFRKPFAVAGYNEQSLMMVSLKLKTVFVTSQIIGYTLSKY
jgi:hypothetical protein